MEDPGQPSAIGPVIQEIQGLGFREMGFRVRGDGGKGLRFRGLA